MPVNQQQQQQNNSVPTAAAVAFLSCCLPNSYTAPLFHDTACYSPKRCNAKYHKNAATLIAHHEVVLARCKMDKERAKVKAPFIRLMVMAPTPIIVALHLIYKTSTSVIMSL
jgi:hypothetical protein